MIEIFPDHEALSQAAARFFVEKSNEAVKENGRFLAALSGGSTPAPFFELLGKPPFIEQIPWAQIHLFWGDERLVPPTDAGSNYHQAAALFLNHVPIPEQNIHRALGELSPTEAVSSYIKQLKSIGQDEEAWPSFDLVILGMGKDGHTASLFPGKISQEERVQPVISVTADYDGRPANRISFTPRLINKAQNILVLVTGHNKAQTLAQVIQGPVNIEQWPIQRIHPHNGVLYWYIDETAAQHLSYDN